MSHRAARLLALLTFLLGATACSSSDKGAPTAETDGQAAATTRPTTTAPTTPAPTEGTTTSDVQTPAPQLTEAELEACQVAMDNASTLLRGSENLEDDVGLKDMSSGRGGVVGSWVNYTLTTVRLAAADAARDGGILQSPLTRFVRSPNYASDNGWNDVDAMTVGQRFVELQVACSLHEVEPSGETPEDWEHTVEWVSGIPPEKNPYSAEEFCRAMSMERGVAAFDEALTDPVTGPGIAGMIGASALFECPEHLETAAQVAGTTD